MRPTEIARRLDFSHDARPLVCWGAKGRRFNILPVLASALLFASVAAGQAEEPIRLHPDNPHFFLWRGQPTVLITAGEHYGAAMNLDFDYLRYLDELKANRFNLTRVFSGTYREVPGSFNITGNTLAPAKSRYLCPWACSETRGAADGGNKFDLTKWDAAYFGRLKDFVTQAGQRGVAVELIFFCTKTGDSEKAETFNHAGGDKIVASPEYSEDIALRITRPAP